MDSETVEISVDTMTETQAIVVSEEFAPEILETVSEREDDILEEIDYIKLSLEERAVLLPVPTDDYEAEYDAYRQRMGYTEEKMKSIRYKMTVYDEFLEEYNYRKKNYGVDDSKTVAIATSKKSRGER